MNLHDDDRMHVPQYCSLSVCNMFLGLPNNQLNGCSCPQSIVNLEQEATDSEVERPTLELQFQLKMEIIRVSSTGIGPKKAWVQGGGSLEAGHFQLISRMTEHQRIPNSKAECQGAGQFSQWNQVVNWSMRLPMGQLVNGSIDQ